MARTSALDVVRGKLEESREKNWTIAESMVESWLWAGLQRQPTPAEIEEGKLEFRRWLTQSKGAR